MDERKRQELLDRLQRSSQTIGKDIPDELTVQGETLDLNEFVFECKRLETVSEEDRKRIEELKRDLQRERLERKQQIERENITDEEGERLVKSVHGIDRALNALESIDSPGIEAELRQKQIDDAKELLALIDKGKV
jgi:phenylalanyl-tRNA synthetase alpha subunit